MRNLAQLDEGFFAHMKDGKDMFDATAREIRNTYQQLGAGITQIQENIKKHHKWRQTTEKRSRS